MRSRWLETIDGGIGEYDRAGTWRLRQPKDVGPRPPPPPVADWELEGQQLQDLAEAVPQLLDASAGDGLRFRVGVSLDAGAPASVHGKVDEILASAVPGMKSDSRKESKAS